MAPYFVTSLMAQVLKLYLLGDCLLSLAIITAGAALLVFDLILGSNNGNFYAYYCAAAGNLLLSLAFCSIRVLTYLPFQVPVLTQISQ